MPRGQRRRMSRLRASSCTLTDSEPPPWARRRSVIDELARTARGARRAPSYPYRQFRHRRSTTEQIAQAVSYVIRLRSTRDAIFAVGIAISALERSDTHETHAGLVGLLATASRAAAAVAQVGHPVKGSWSGYWGTEPMHRSAASLLLLDWADQRDRRASINPGPNASDDRARPSSTLPPGR